MKCWAFFSNSNGNCRLCGHHWQNHMHFLYDLEEETRTVEDPRIKSMIESNASDEATKAAAIDHRRKLSEEYKGEYKQIQQAAARFGVFLSTHSITAYNDKTIEYLDLLIKQEKEKVGNAQGPVRKKLESLETSKAEYLEFQAAVKANLHGGRAGGKTRNDLQPLDQAGVTRLVQRLYSLPHFGNNLRKVRNTIVSASAATYRERPHTVRMKKGKKGRSASGHGKAWKVQHGGHYSEPMPGTFVDEEGFPVVPRGPPSPRLAPRGPPSPRYSRHVATQRHEQSSSWNPFSVFSVRR
jgi:hypothetical protein